VARLQNHDAGAHWTLLFTNADPKGFFDAIAFWDAQHGIVVGDPVDGRAEVLTTDDGGATWQRRSPPAALPNEGSFAASNTCLTLFGKRDAWFATGGPGAARVFHSKDRGRSWTVATTPIRNDGPSAGIFSLAFRDARHGIAVGGDYSKDSRRSPEHRPHLRWRTHLVGAAERRPQRLPFRRRLAARLPQALDRHRHLRFRRLQ
jgi:photosystem II stability/assembly factor-like uncharacterized protein